MTALLDANVLIALVVADHVHHDRVAAWFVDTGVPFATCPVTQGALVRTVLRGGGTAEQALEVLEGVMDDARHESWADDVSFREVSLRGVVGHRQVTDAYLAALARRHEGELVTLDRGLALLHPDVAVLLDD